MTTAQRTRTASCACGGLTAVAVGEPADVHLCSCRDCQPRSGSAFSYAGLYPDGAVTVAGERTSFRQTRDAGHWIEMIFCATCGVAVAWRAEALPGTGASRPAAAPTGNFPRRGASTGPRAAPAGSLRPTASR